MTYQRHHNNKIDYNTQYFYRDFLKQHTGLKISQETYTLILKTLFELVVHKIIHEAYRFLFPGIGIFYLVRRKQKLKKNKDGSISIYAPINWVETKKLIAKTGDKSKKVYHLNDHTDRHIYEIIWDKKRIQFRNKFFYIFAINRKHKQALKNAIFDSDVPLNAYESTY